MTDLLLHNARLLDPARGIDETGYVAVADGVITHAGPGDADAATHKAAAESVDCAGACLAPGLIDMRVKTADPGAEHLEDLTTLLTAAAAAGITSLVALPDTEPVIDDASMIDSLSLRATRISGARLCLSGAATSCCATLSSTRRPWTMRCTERCRSPSLVVRSASCPSRCRGAASPRSQWSCGSTSCS